MFTAAAAVQLGSSRIVTKETRLYKGQECVLIGLRHVAFEI